MFLEPKTALLPLADIYFLDFSTYFFQQELPVPVSELSATLFYIYVCVYVTYIYIYLFFYAKFTV